MRTKVSTLAFVASLGLLAAGCLGKDESYDAAAIRDAAGLRAAPARKSLEELRAYYHDATRVTFSPEHGTQVAYTAPDGAIHLWYPGNDVVVRGRWRLKQADRFVRSGLSTEGYVSSTEICFVYGSNTYNPVTRAAGGSESCMPADAPSRMGERAEGDPFKLAGSKPPFILGRERVDLATLKRRVGG